MKKRLITMLLIILGIATLVYAAGKVTDLTELTSMPATTDLFTCVDISDTMMAVTGTNKKIEWETMIHRTLEMHTSNYTVLSTDLAKYLTNRGATANITFTLPECVASPSGTSQVGEGWVVFFLAMNGSYDLIIDPPANDSIENESDGEAGEYIYVDDEVGALLGCLCAQGTGQSGTEADAYNWYQLSTSFTVNTQD